MTDSVAEDQPVSSVPSRARISASLQNPNFRRYLIGQGLSHTGMWVQQMGELWLILALTGSSSAVAFHPILRFGPVLLFGMQAGLLADRFDRRSLLILTQTLHALSAITLALVAWLTTPSLMFVYAIVLTQGIVNALDISLRRTFVRDLVPDTQIANAVSLNSSVGTLSKTVGPAIGGLLILVSGVEVCFAVNAASYGAVIIALFLIDTSTLRPSELVHRQSGQLWAGLSYAFTSTEIRDLLVLAAATGVFAWNWSILIPVYSTQTFAGDEALFGVMVSAVGVGSFVGAVLAAREKRHSLRYVRWALISLFLSLTFAAAAPNVTFAIVGLLLLGVSGTSVIVSTQSRLQSTVENAMSGRLMAIFSVAFVGAIPIGGVSGGLLMAIGGPRIAFGVGALSMGLASLYALRGSLRGRQ